LTFGIIGHITNKLRTQKNHVRRSGATSPDSLAGEDQAFSSSGMIKEIEEMKKAAEKGKPAQEPQPGATQQPASPTALQK
jgi:hypothetical protein